jgi:hypothetical protein
MPVVLALRVMPPLFILCGSLALLFIRGASPRRRSSRVALSVDIIIATVLLIVAYFAFT